jgi:hypothetical protein
MDTVAERYPFWLLGVGSFVVRRVLERVQVGELTLLEATRRLSHCSYGSGGAMPSLRNSRCVDTDARCASEVRK